MSGLFSSKSSSTSKSTPNKATQALFDPIFNAAQAQNAKPFTPYAGQLSQGQTADQMAARGMLQPGQGGESTQAGIGAAQGLLGYQPNQITAPNVSASQLGNPMGMQAAQIDRSQVQDLNPQSFAGSDMSAYQNPYTSEVIDQTLADIDRQRQISLNGQAGQFTQAGAFGGSRHGVADSLTNEAYGRTAAQTAAGLRSQGFDTAAGLLNNDINRQMQAQGANQAADLSVLGQNAGYGQQAGQFNAGAANDFAAQNANYQQQAGQFNAANNLQAQQANQSAGLQGNSQQLQAAGLLGSLGQQQQQMGLLDANTLNSYGTQQQETEQQALDRQYQQYLLQQGYGQQQFQNNLGLLGGIGNLYAGATQKGTQTSTPGLGSILGVGLQAASMFSDVRLKADIEPVGMVNGRNWYRYRYIWDEPGVRHHGVMAHEVLRTDPDAVSVDGSGFLKVDYGRLN